MPFTIDLQFLGRARVIATAAIPCDDGVVLVDPGPSSCRAALGAGLAQHGYGLGDVRALLLTHIHLDHAGAAGTLAQAFPGLPVYVHEVGARHLASPEKLLASATRLYGADMERLWGEFRAVPAAALRPLSGGETIAIAGRRFDVLYTPGHAVHHVSYRDHADGMALRGRRRGHRGAGRATCCRPRRRPTSTWSAGRPPSTASRRGGRRGCSSRTSARWREPAAHLAAYRVALGARRRARAARLDGRGRRGDAQRSLGASGCGRTCGAC